MIEAVLWSQLTRSSAPPRNEHVNIQIICSSTGNLVKHAVYQGTTGVSSDLEAPFSFRDSFLYGSLSLLLLLQLLLSCSQVTLLGLNLLAQALQVLLTLRLHCTRGTSGMPVCATMRLEDGTSRAAKCVKSICFRMHRTEMPSNVLSGQPMA